MTTLDEGDEEGDKTSQMKAATRTLVLRAKEEMRRSEAD
jgi:hypothetical protein